MEHSEYKDKHFHVVVSYWKESGYIFGVETADKEKLSDEDAEERVRFCNEGRTDIVRKILPVDKEVSQLIYFLYKERSKDKQSCAEALEGLVRELKNFRYDVEETLDCIKEDLEREKSNNK